jgi:5'-deoxynucleotidase YfbR-like HD superfamily hydrolase
MTLITTAEQLADAIITDPQRVAECLHRINRFGGQVPNCTVLRHSLEVYYRIDADPDSSDAARLWALLHDCHEVLTGDVVRPYVNARLRMDQQAIDNAIIRRLPQLVPQPDSISWRQVMAADRAVGDFELMQIERDRTPYDRCEYAEDSWTSLVRELITIGGAA